MNPWEFGGQLAENIRNARLASHMTQSDLAQQIGCTKVCISQYETARRMPNLRIMSAICHVLDMSLDDMVPMYVPEARHDLGQTSIFDVIGE